MLDFEFVLYWVVLCPDVRRVLHAFRYAVLRGVIFVPCYFVSCGVRVVLWVELRY